MAKKSADVRKLEPQEVQIRRVGDGLFEIARYRVNGEYHYEPFDIAEVPEGSPPEVDPPADARLAKDAAE